MQKNSCVFFQSQVIEMVIRWLLLEVHFLHRCFRSEPSECSQLNLDPDNRYSLLTFLVILSFLFFYSVHSWPKWINVDYTPCTNAFIPLSWSMVNVHTLKILINHEFGHFPSQLWAVAWFYWFLSAFTLLILKLRISGIFKLSYCIKCAIFRGLFLNTTKVPN